MPKISISLSSDMLRYLDERARISTGGRSGHLERLLVEARNAELTDAYTRAFAEWADSEDSQLWDALDGSA